MSSKKIVVVYGATGQAGGSVAKYLLEDGVFAVRGVTRNPKSASAQALKAKGAEVVFGDLDKPETLPLTLKGAYGVAAVTDFWTIYQNVLDIAKAQEGETAQGKALVDAAKNEGIKHFVFFTLPHSDVPHFESKYQVGEYLKASGFPYTNICNCAYFEALNTFKMFSKTEDGVLQFSFMYPDDALMPGYSVNQSGGWVLQALNDPQQYLGKELHAVGENISPRKFTEVLGRVLGKEVNLKSFSLDDFFACAKSPDPYVREVYLNLKYFYDNQPPEGEWSVEESKKVYPGQYTFEEFARKDEAFNNFIRSV